MCSSYIAWIEPDRYSMADRAVARSVMGPAVASAETASPNAERWSTSRCSLRAALRTSGRLLGAGSRQTLGLYHAPLVSSRRLRRCSQRRRRPARSVIGCRSVAPWIDSGPAGPERLPNAFGPSPRLASERSLGKIPGAGRRRRQLPAFAYSWSRSRSSASGFHDSVAPDSIPGPSIPSRSATESKSAGGIRSSYRRALRISADRYGFPGHAASQARH